MRSRFLTAAICAVLLACPGGAFAQTASSGLPPEVASAGVTQTQWGVVRVEVRRQASRARVSERALLAAAEATGARFAASGRFNALSLQQAVFEALEDQADQIAELQTRLDRLTGDADPAIAGLFAQARATLEAGRLREADRQLADISARDLAGLQAADAEADRHRLRAGDTIAARGQVAFLQADYLAAADHYARAADTVPQTALEERWKHQIHRARALYERGERFNEADSLRLATRVYLDQATPLAPLSARPYDWAVTQNNLGNAYWGLGRGGDASAQRNAVNAFRAALSVWTLEIAPNEWAHAQSNLGAALSMMGESGDLEASSQAVTAFNAALQVFTHISSPVEWAEIQTNLSGAQNVLGDFASSAAASRYALSVFNPIEHPDQYARAQNNLGNALRQLGYIGDGVAFQEAIAAFEAALEVDTRERSPAGWAGAQFNLGLTYLGLGGLGDDAALGLAQAAFHNALQVFRRDDSPRQWASIRTAQAEVLLLLAERGDGAAASRAIACANDALIVLTVDNTPRDWARTQAILADALRLAGPNDERLLRQSISAYRAALQIYSQAGSPGDWARNTLNLGVTLGMLSQTGDDSALPQAIVALEDALRVYTRQIAPLDWADTTLNLAQAHMLNGNLGRARDEATAARAVYLEFGDAAKVEQIDALLVHLNRQ